MSNPVRLGFIGKAGAGKTTMADKADEWLGSERVSFAQRLKLVARVKDDVPERDWRNVLYRMGFDLLAGGGYFHVQRQEMAEDLALGWMKDFREATDYRDMLQRIGTDTGRRVDPLLWIRPVQAEVYRMEEDTPLTIDDVRFENEADALRRMGFGLVRVMVAAPEERQRRIVLRDGEGKVKTTLGNRQTMHPSELEQMNIVADLEVDNGSWDGGNNAFYRVRNWAEGFFQPNKEEGIQVVIPEEEYKVEEEMYYDPSTPEGAFARDAEALKGALLESYKYEVTKYDDGSYGHTFELMTEGDKDVEPDKSEEQE